MSDICIGCPVHLKVCMAECCRQFSFNVEGFDAKKLKRGMIVKFNVPGMSDDIRNYYELHGLRTSGDTVTIELLAFKVSRNKLTIYKKCNALNDELLCSLHGTSKQPKICSYPNIREGSADKNIYITKNCLYDKNGGIQRRWKKKYQETS